MNIITREIQTHWTAISHLFSVRNEEEYDRAIGLISSLLDEIGTDERHPLYALLDTLGTLVYEYEEKHYPMPECSAGEMPEFFMEEHGLNPSDLPEIGSEADVSDIIAGKREITVREIQCMARRFHVSPAVFI